MFFRFTTAGESHGKALITIVEGLPAGMPLDVDSINHELWRRQQGYGRGGRMKIEKDEVEILSGIRHGKTLGSPVALMIENKDFVHWQEVMSVSSPHVNEGLTIESDDQDAAAAAHSTAKNKREVKRPRPGHADLAGGQKFATRDLRNILERASARETAARVAAGALAKQLLTQFGIDVRSHVIQLGGIPSQPLSKNWDEICTLTETSPLNCADDNAQAEMVAAIDRAKENGDTLGGIYEVVARGVPVGLGSHTSWNEKLDGRIAQAFMSIHATKAVEIGTGVTNAAKAGSEVHDEIFFFSGSPPYEGALAVASGDGVVLSQNDEPNGTEKPHFLRRTNRAGGLEGGITNGEELRVRGYMKPISTLRKPLHSIDIDTKQDDLAAFERSDITAVPAAGVIGESMLAIVLANSMREKFGGDSLDEMRANFESYCAALSSY
jgi:chorismate synthase